MRRLLRACLFALPLAASATEHNHEHDEHQHAEHGSLDAHAHGAAQLNVVLDGQCAGATTEGPAMNLVGFEHNAGTDADKAKVAAARSQLEQPTVLFGVNAGDRSLNQTELQSPLFAEHAGIPRTRRAITVTSTHYTLDCQAPGPAQTTDLAELFKRFPATEKFRYN